MKDFLKKKHVTLSPKVYFIDALGAMAYGLFATLLVGTLINTLGQILGWAFLTDTLWPLAQKATGPAIAVSIAYILNAPDLVLFASTVIGLAGYELGGPVGVYVAALVGVEIGKLISKETVIDLILTPFVTVVSGVLVAQAVGPYIQNFMLYLGKLVMTMTNQSPLIMGVLVSVVVGIVLTLPISSAALCMMLSLSGLAGGAATIGCCCQMVGFAVMSYPENGFSGLLAQGLGTSMLQMPNIMKNWRILLPPSLAAAILGPIATTVYPMMNNPLGSGMGTCGLVGQITTLQTMASEPISQVLLAILFLQILLPAILSTLICVFMKKRSWIKEGDLTLMDLDAIKASQEA